MRKLGFRRSINWVFNPAAGIIAGTLGEEMLIYHCVDEYSAFSGVNSPYLSGLEKRLLQLADLTIVSSDSLYESKVRMNPRTALVRHGVDFEHFNRALLSDTHVPPEIAQLPRPTGHAAAN